MKIEPRKFNRALIQWQLKSGRHDLPWQVSDPYAIWLSEIMLQQTQVQTVIPYYLKFINKYPTVQSLAEAELNDVLYLWSGLGYYARARNLHYAANQIVNNFAGMFPQDRVALESLKGIGRSTAAAICVFAYQQKEAICDGNVIRVLSRYFAFNEDVTSSQAKKKLWAIAEALLPDESIISYTQGLMDLGSLVCKRSKPNCEICPLSANCQAFKSELVVKYPIKKKKKAIPIKKGYFIYIHNNEGHVYLEKRPEKGIWGGLYCLPWFDSLEDAESWLKSNGYQSYQIAQEKKLQHQFTHFKLEIYLITAKCLEISNKNFINIESQPLPVPIKKLTRILQN